jgi:hypothetical protein
LGGHASKKHPGASKSYNKKVQRRAERNNDRLVLLVAKAVMGIEQDNFDTKPQTKGKGKKRVSKQQNKCKLSERERGRIRRLKGAIKERLGMQSLEDYTTVLATARQGCFKIKMKNEIISL